MTRCVKFCLRLGPNPTTALCSGICIAVVGGGCLISTSDICDPWCGD
ncbi:hypothetical protein [Pasteuria penetrans]|nr:hypothetical protein [Pasteuria penetrans]